MLSGEFCFFFWSCHKNLHSSDTVYHGATIFNGSRTHKRVSFYEGMGSVIPIKLPVRENEKTQFLSFEGLWAKLALTIVKEKAPTIQPFYRSYGYRFPIKSAARLNGGGTAKWKDQL